MVELEERVKAGEEREREIVQQGAWDRLQMENQVEIADWLRFFKTFIFIFYALFILICSAINHI